MRAQRTATIALALAALLAPACASGPDAPNGIATTPRSAANPNGLTYPGPCSKMTLEYRPQSSPGRGSAVDNLGTWTDEVVASYRPGDREKEAQILARVRHEQPDEVWAKTNRKHEYECGPEAEVIHGGGGEERAVPVPVPPSPAVKPVQIRGAALPEP